MANIKKITHLWNVTGLTVYCIIRRDADGYLLNDADGAFASGPADPYVSLAEDATIKGMYELSESRAAWDDGDYSVVVYRQTGVSPVPTSDIVIGGGVMEIKSDAEVTNVNIESEDNIDFGALKKVSLNAATPTVTLAASQHVIVDSGTVTTLTNAPTDMAKDSTVAKETTLGTVAAYIDTEITTIMNKTNLIPASPAATGDIPTAAQIADAVHDEVFEGEYTLRQALRLLISVLGCVSAGGGTTSITFKNVAGTKDRVTATVDSNGNRSVVTLDLTE